MHIHHIAIWTGDIERLRRFYETYFGARSGGKYINRAKGFESYFLKFDHGAQIEIMSRTDINTPTDKTRYGYAHMAISTGSRETVDSLTEHLRTDGFVIQSEPRVTGDGFYESVILDPDGNLVEITE